MADMGVEADVEEIRVSSEAEAEELHMLGSPTVQVEGRDLDPAAAGRTDYSTG